MCVCVCMCVYARMRMNVCNSSNYNHWCQIFHEIVT